MLKIIEYFFDLIFPPRDTELCIRNTLHGETEYYSPRAHNDVWFLASYETPFVKALIKENKYHHNQLAAKILANMLSRWVHENTSGPVRIIPIPQSKERAKEREHNQIESILRHALFSKDTVIDTNVIKKSHHTVTQTSLKKAERLTNVMGSFSFCGSVIAEGTTIIIVDDVVTTGATMKAARASLAPHLPPGVTITLLAIAH